MSLRRIFVCLLLLLLVVLVIAISGRNYVLERTVKHYLNARHIPVQSLRVETLSPTHILLRDVALGEAGEMKAASADITPQWQGSSLMGANITVQSAQVKAVLFSGGIALGGVERAWGVAALPPESAVPTTLNIDGNFALHYGMDGTLEATLDAVKFTASREGKALLLPLTFRGDVRGALKDTLMLDLAFTGAQEKLHGTVRGQIAPGKQSGTLAWKTDPLRFAADQVQFAEMSPLFAENLATIPVTLSSSGTLVLNQGTWEVNPTLTLEQLPLAGVFASVLGEGATVEGLIGGAVPLKVNEKGWRIDAAQLKNQGALHVAVAPGSPSAQALSNQPQAQIVLGALSNFQVATMTLDVGSRDAHGGIAMQWHFLGRNPDFFRGRPVDFTLAVTANLEDMLKGAAAAKAPMQQVPTSPSTRSGSPTP